MNADAQLAAHAIAAQRVRQFRLHLALASRHLTLCAELETEVQALLPQCTPAARAAIAHALDGITPALARTGHAPLSPQTSTTTTPCT